MSEKILFESHGGNKTREILQFVVGAILSIIGFLLLINVATDNGGISHSGYGGTWSYRKAPGIETWIFVILLLVLGVVCLYSGIASKKSYLKVYENHIEAKSFDVVRLVIGGNGSIQSDINLAYNEIQGVSIQKGMIVIDTYGKSKNIFCPDCITAKNIINKQLEKNKYNS